VGLIPSPRHTAADLAAWERWAALDRRLAQSPALARREAAALDALRTFAAAGPCYVGVSWGKDSVVVAHLARQVSPDLPLVWVRLSEARDNPDCYAVRDAFLARWPGEYHEVWSGHQDDGGQLATGARRGGYAEAGRRFGDRYVSGVRADESRERRLRVARWGVATERTCAPLARWSGADVFAYLERYDLPIHPAYACTFGGALDRCRIRVASLGGERGTGHGRQEWEAAYYRAEVAALARGIRTTK